MARKPKKTTSSNPTQGKVTRYKSRFSDKYIALPQYLAELMCERRAKNLGVDLPTEFWRTSPLWKNYFFYQLKLAQSLTKSYTSTVILDSLNEMKYVYSLKLAALLDLIEKKSKEVKVEIEIDIQPTLTQSSGIFNRRKGMLGKLDG